MWMEIVRISTSLSTIKVSYKFYEESLKIKKKKWKLISEELYFQNTST